MGAGQGGVLVYGTHEGVVPDTFEAALAVRGELAAFVSVQAREDGLPVGVVLERMLEAGALVYGL